MTIAQLRSKAARHNQEVDKWCKIGDMVVNPATDPPTTGWMLAVRARVEALDYEDEISRRLNKPRY